MDLVFYSLDDNENKIFFRTSYELLDNQIVFDDKSMENTKILLTISENSLIFERKGNVCMKMNLVLNEETKGIYENSNGLSFEFSTLCKSLLITKKKIEIEYSLFVMMDEISSHKIWITFN